MNTLELVVAALYIILFGAAYGYNIWVTSKLMRTRTYYKNFYEDMYNKEYEIMSAHFEEVVTQNDSQARLISEQAGTIRALQSGLSEGNTKYKLDKAESFIWAINCYSYLADQEACYIAYNDHRLGWDIYRRYEDGDYRIGHVDGDRFVITDDGNVKERFAAFVKKASSKGNK